MIQFHPIKIKYILLIFSIYVRTKKIIISYIFEKRFDLYLLINKMGQISDLLIIFILIL
jgi:hypothetical protein